MPFGIRQKIIWVPIYRENTEHEVHMNKTIATVRRYVNNVEVTREELLSRKISNPVLDHLYQTAVRRGKENRRQYMEKQSS